MPRLLITTAVLAASLARHGGSAAAQPPADILRGPAVHEAPAPGPSLVAYDYAGQVRRLTTSPEEAALRFLPLDPQTRERTDLIIAQRTRLFDTIIAENLELLLRIAAAAPAGQVLNTWAMLTELYRKSEPLWSRGRFQNELGAALPAAQRADFDHLVNTYWAALVEQDQREAGAKHDHPPRLALLLGEKLRALGEAGERSFQQQLASGSLLYTYLRAAVGLTAEQDVQIRGFVDDFMERHGPTPGEKETQLLLIQVFAHLNARQRETLLSRFIPAAAAYAQRSRSSPSAPLPHPANNTDEPAVPPNPAR